MIWAATFGNGSTIGGTQKRPRELSEEGLGATMSALRCSQRTVAGAGLVTGLTPSVFAVWLQQRGNRKMGS